MDTDDAATHDPALENRMRSRYYHTCGQMIWVVAMPDRFVYYAELRPQMPAPLSLCPRCGELLTRDTLAQRPQPGAQGAPGND